MNVLKKTFLVLIVSFIHLYLLEWLLEAYEFRSIAFALLLNCLVVSWVALVGQFVSIAFGSRCYRIQAIERSGRVYERFGISFFKILVGRTPWVILNPKLRFSGKTARISDLEKEMQKAEAGHFIAFAVVTAAAVFVAVQREWIAAGWYMVFNVPFNLYPVMLQRYNRARIQRIQKRLGIRNELEMNMK